MSEIEDFSERYARARVDKNSETMRNQRLGSCNIDTIRTPKKVSPTLRAREHYRANQFTLANKKGPPNAFRVSLGHSWVYSCGKVYWIETFPNKGRSLCLRIVAGWSAIRKLGRRAPLLGVPSMSVLARVLVARLTGRQMVHLRRSSLNADVDSAGRSRRGRRMLRSVAPARAGGCAIVRQAGSRAPHL